MGFHFLVERDIVLPCSKQQSKSDQKSTGITIPFAITFLDAPNLEQNSSKVKDIPSDNAIA